AGIRSQQFNIHQLQDFLAHHTADATRFRRWVRQARTRFVREIEAAAERREVVVSPSVPEPDVPALETVR
ncbi:MAG TPA: hypothetical protein VJ884_04520, partial [Salinibacter sp.]|nr:hypothetical protein [Salinibacter sp.]